MVMLEHLRIAKHHLEPAFPPKYNIFQYCVSLFHEQVGEGGRGSARRDPHSFSLLDPDPGWKI